METLPDLTRDDFLAYGGPDIVSPCDKKECLAYAYYFAERANEAVSMGDAKAEQLFRLLASITMLHIRHDTPEGPFGPVTLDDSSTEFLGQIVDDVSDPELRARIADVLCLQKPDYRMAERAVKAYIESAKRLEDPVEWIETADRLERALQLSAKWGKKSDRFEAVVECVEEILTTYDGEDPSLLSARLMTFLQDVKAGDSTRNAARAEKAALRAESTHEWHRAREYWAVKARWHALDKDDASMHSAKKQEAETHVKEADDALNRTPPSYMQTSAFLRLAIEALRRIPESKQRVNELHQILLEYQQKAVREMVPISSSADISDLVETAKKHVEGQTLYDALSRLAMLCAPPKLSGLRSQAEENRNRFVLRQLFPNVYHNAMGRVIAKQPKDAEEAVLADMFHNASYCHGVRVQGLIEPARYQILSEHSVRVDDILPFVVDNPLIRRGREYIVARGLYAGLQGDFLTAVHLLIPQAEDSIRFLLSHLQVITSGLDDDGIQDEYNLNKMLSASEYTVPLASALGEDLVFDMRGLLVERFGSNLRNDMAHGLLSHDVFYTEPSCYFWWMMLHLYAWPTYAQLHSHNGETDTLTPEKGGEAAE